MLRISLCLLFLFLSIASTGCYAQQIKSTELAPEEQDAYTWDFGQVKAGEILKHSFVFKSESKAVLNIKNVNTSCGCTVSEVKKDTLSPGESTQIEVRFNTKGYSGPVIQYIYVNTDDLDNPVVRYIIKAEVVK